jgi:hypothetical protein
MKRTRYVSFSNQADGFFMKYGKDHQEMYRRLKAIATTFKNLGAHHIDDEWIKMKYVLAYMLFEPADLKSVQGRHKYHDMTSNQVMQEMQAYKVAAQNAEDARAIRMQKSSNLALKASVDEREVTLQASVDARLEMCPEDMRHEYHENMAFYGKTFWVDPNKAKEDNQRRSKSSGFQRNDNNGQRVRTCYNCSDRFHFVAKFPYEKREDHGGKLILQNKNKSPSKKPFVKKGGSKKKQPKFVFLTQEECSRSESDEEETSTSKVATIATTSTSPTSLFESPNEDSTIKNVKYLMAKSSEVSPTPSSPISKTNDASLNDLASLRVKKEIIAFDGYVSSVQGVHKLHFESLMSQYGQTLEKLDEQRWLEKVYAHEIASLKDSLEGEEEEQATLEEKLDSIEETNNEVISKLIKERDHACAKVNVLKKEKIEFGVGLDKLVKDLEDLDKAHKALKSEHSILTKSHEQLQI